jgi:hypothetical protein
VGVAVGRMGVRVGVGVGDGGPGVSHAESATIIPSRASTL